MSDDIYGFSGLYYKAQDNCHADFIAKDFFTWMPSDNSPCRKPRSDVWYHCRENFTIYEQSSFYTLSMLSKAHELGKNLV